MGKTAGFEEWENGIAKAMWGVCGEKIERVTFHDATYASFTVPLYRRLELTITTKPELILVLQFSPSDLPV